MKLGSMLYIAEENDHVVYNNVYVYRLGIVETYHTHKSRQHSVKRISRADAVEIPYNF